MIRALLAGLIIGAIAPLIGIFLVLRRYSLIADTLSHVSLAGVAIGLFLKVPPLVTAIGAALLSSVAIERLRLSKRVYGESALSLFLSGSLAIAVVIIGLTKGLGTDLFAYLFGSIVTVTTTDIWLMVGIGILVFLTVLVCYKELVFLTFDEEGAKAAGLPTKWLNALFIMVTAVTVAFAIPVIGVLLISALIVIPAVTALQLKSSFTKTILAAEIFSLCSVLCGIILSFYANLPTGGTIVLVALVVFAGVYIAKK